MRPRSLGAASTALSTGLALTLSLTAASAGTAQAAPGGSGAHAARPTTKVVARRATTVTLPTGDHVMVSGSSKKPQIRLQPAATSGPGRVLVSHRVGNHLYVMPAVAEPYLGRFLDPGLFDVTRLEANLKANGHLPVRISYQGATPAVPGVKITSHRSGVAKGYLTAASAPKFGRALTARWKADRKAGFPRRSTLFTGVTRMVPDLPSKALVKPHYPMHTLIIKTIGPDGKPQPEGFIVLINVDNGAKYNGFVEAVDGEARVSVPTGNYSVAGDDLQYNEAANTGTFRLTTVNEYKVTGSGQTLTLDYRTATQRASVTTPKPADLVNYTFGWNRSDAAGNSSLGDFYGMDAGTDLLITPGGPAKVGKLSVTQNWQLVAPGSTPAYSFDLATVADRIPADLHSTFQDGDLGTVDSSYYGDGKATDAGFVRMPEFPGSDGGFGSFIRVPQGTHRAEYVGTTGAKATWFETLLANYDSFDDPGFVDAPDRTVPVGTTQTVDWLRGPLGAGIPKQSGDFAYCYACRTAKKLEISVAPFLDSDPTHSGELFGAEDGLPVARFRFYRNGKKVHDEDDELGGQLTVPAAKATYKAVIDVDRRLQEPRQSTSSRTEYGFSSAKGGAGKLPSTWACGLGDTKNCRVLPVLQAKVDLPVSLTGTLPAGKSTVTVTVARVQHAPASAPKTVVLEFRPAGWSWTSVKLTSAGGGKYTGTLDATDFGGALADLRVSATDKGGSSYRQTVLRAFTVAGS